MSTPVKPDVAERVMPGMAALPSVRTSSRIFSSPVNRSTGWKSDVDVSAPRSAALLLSSPPALRQPPTTVQAARMRASATATLPALALPTEKFQVSSPAKVPVAWTPPTTPVEPQKAAAGVAGAHVVPAAVTRWLARDSDVNTAAPTVTEWGAGEAGPAVHSYALPNAVLSAGGLQSLSFTVQHREDDGSLDLSCSTRSSSPSVADEGNSSNVTQKPSGDHAAPLVQARMPAHLVTRLQLGGYSDVEDDWYDLTTGDAADEESEEAEQTISPDGDKETTGATESVAPSESPSGTCTNPSKGTPSESILMPTARRPSRSSEGSLVESIPFHNRVVMRQETDADVQCFHAYEYVRAFFEQRGDDVDEDPSGSSWSSQTSRPSSRSRSRVAVVHGTDFQLRRSPRRIPTEEERKAAFVSRTLKEMYTHMAHAYQTAGIPKGYLDTLHMMEVHSGARQARPHDARHRGTTEDPLSPVSSDGEEVQPQLSGTEVVLADFDVDNALQQALQRGEGRGRGRGGRGYGGPRRKEKEAMGKASTNQPRGSGRSCNAPEQRQEKHAPPGTSDGTTEKDGAHNRPRPRQGSAYAFMLRVLRKNTVHYDYQHNPMRLHEYKALRRSGNVAVNGKTFRLPIWDDERNGYLVTGVFDRTLGHPKNYQDVLTNELYAEERMGGVSTSFPAPEMARQHNAVNARCVKDVDGVTLRGCSIVRHPDVFGIYDGRVHGCQVPRSCRDHRRSGMHAAIQSLAHYMNLFSKYPSLVRLLHPQDRYRYPVVNPVGGMYCVPLIVNGAARLVKVDDYVPIDQATGVFRCLTSSANEFFPALLEKALLKANGGGVTFALMEACQVLHQLCGWIPQVIPFVTDYGGSEVLWDGMLYPAEMWEWLAGHYRAGRLAMSLAGVWGSEEAKAAPTFVRRTILSRPARFTAPVSFPVVDLISHVESTEGRGVRRIRAVMLRDTTKDPTDAEFAPPVRTALSEAMLSTLGYTAVHRDAGVFCVTWEEATTFFDHCSVSLCPSTYWSKEETKPKPKEATRICCHDTYDMRKEGNVMFHQPQYHLCFSDVESSTPVFVVYTQHTSLQHPLPWPCEGLANATVDRCSGGGAAVQLRVYEVTTLPSILQVCRGEGSPPGCCCTFTHCVGRRLTGELEGPRATRLVATAVGRANTMITVPFDVSPGTREYVLVVGAEAELGTDPAARMKTFPYTLTLYTSMSALEQANPRCVPFVAPRAPPGSAERSRAATRRSRLRAMMEDGDGSRRAPVPTATMHAIPPALEVNSLTVQGVWGPHRTPRRVLTVKHDLVTEELSTGPQFRLHLSQPDDFFIRLYATSQSSLSPAAAAMKLLLVRKTSQRSRCLSGYAMGQCDLLLESNGWSTDGAVLDSVSPHTVLLDRRHELVLSPMRTRREYNAVVNMVLFLDPEDEVEEASCLLVRHPDPSDCVQSLIVRAFAQGMLISTEACRVTCMGNAVAPEMEIRRLLSHRAACYTFNAANGESTPVAEEDGPQSYASREPCLDIFVDVEVLNTSPFMAVDFPENEQSGRLVSRLRSVAQQTLLTGTQQRSKALRALSHISSLIQQSGLTEEKANFLLGIATGIADWCTMRASCKAMVLRSSPLMMRQLPAGDYTIVTCFNPTAGSYARNKEDPRGPPTLIASGDVHFNLEVQLLRQRVKMTAIAATVDPVTKMASSHSVLLNEYNASK